MALALSGCTAIQSVSLTQIPENRSQEVTAYGTQYSFLGIAFTNHFIDRAMDDLKSQCPRGRLEGVLTEYQETLYLLIFEREVKVSAYCISGADS